MIALVLVLAGLATWQIVSWIQAGDDRATAERERDRARAELTRLENDEAITFAHARSEVDKVGQDGILTFNTLDYRKVDEGLDAWERISTGPLHDEIVANRETSRKALEQARTTTTAKVLSAAVTELDNRAGTAVVIAAVQVTITQEAGQPTDKYLRIQATLQRTGDGWKLSGITNVSANQ